MLNVIGTFSIVIFLMGLPLVVMFRMATSERTRSHLSALLLHDIIIWGWRTCGRLIVGILRLVWKGVTLILSAFTHLLRP